MNYMDPNFNLGLLHKGTCVTPTHFASLDIKMKIINYQKLGISIFQVLSQVGYTVKNWVVVQSKTEIPTTHRGFGTGASMPNSPTYDLTF